MNAKLIAALIVAGIILALSAGCEREEEPEEYIARVNDEYLTREMILERLDESYSINEAMVQEYVNQWMTSEMLYQEARRRGLDRDDRVLKPLQDVRRHLAINALLEDEIYNGVTPDITNEQIEVYFEEHKDEFTADAPLLDLTYVLFESRNLATSFRNSVVQGTDWNDALDTILDDEENTTDIIEIGERGYYRERDIHPPEIWRAARQLGAGGVSFPVAASGGYYIVRHYETIQSGSPYPLDYVANEIKERLVIEKRQEEYENLLLDLRRRYPIDITVDLEVDNTDVQ